MADVNDELLEDGDISDANFELDLAEEDALLADDDDKPLIFSKTVEGEKGSQEDDDYLELGVDEDLSLNEEEVVENGSSSKKHTPIAIAFNDEDSDDNKSGGERTRFKSERNIIARSSSAIPETLDAVAVRQPFNKQNRGGIRGRMLRGGVMRGARGVMRGGMRFQQPHHMATNIHVNPHFRCRLPVPPGSTLQFIQSCM